MFSCAWCRLSAIKVHIRLDYFKTLQVQSYHFVGPATFPRTSNFLMLLVRWTRNIFHLRSNTDCNVHSLSPGNVLSLSLDIAISTHYVQTLQCPLSAMSTLQTLQCPLTVSRDIAMSTHCLQTLQCLLTVSRHCIAHRLSPDITMSTHHVQTLQCPLTFQPL